MVLNSGKKILLAIFVICIFCAGFFAEAIHADDHDCTGEDCPVCLAIQAGHNFLTMLKSARPLLVVSLVMIFFHIVKKHTGQYSRYLSIVTLKVRSNS